MQYGGDVTVSGCYFFGGDDFGGRVKQNVGGIVSAVMQYGENNLAVGGFTSSILHNTEGIFIFSRMKLQNSSSAFYVHITLLIRMSFPWFQPFFRIATPGCPNQ